MPTIASVLDPKLTAVQTRLGAINAKLHASGAYPGLTHEIAEVVDEMRYLQEFAERFVTALRLGPE